MYWCCDMRGLCEFQGLLPVAVTKKKTITIFFLGNKSDCVEGVMYWCCDMRGLCEFLVVLPVAVTQKKLLQYSLKRSNTHEREITYLPVRLWSH